MHSKPNRSLQPEARTSEVIHFLCPEHWPSACPVSPSHSQMRPSMSPLAMYRPSGDHDTTSTQLPCPCAAAHRHSQP